MTARKFFIALTLTGTWYGLAGWLYIVVNSEVHITTLGLPLTHFTSWPHEDTFGSICFATSLISCFSYLLIREDRR